MIKQGNYLNNQRKPPGLFFIYKGEWKVNLLKNIAYYLPALAVIISLLSKGINYLMLRNVEIKLLSISQKIARHISWVIFIFIFIASYLINLFSKSLKNIQSYSAIIALSVLLAYSLYLIGIGVRYFINWYNKMDNKIYFIDKNEKFFIIKRMPENKILVSNKVIDSLNEDTIYRILDLDYLMGKDIMTANVFDQTHKKKANS